MSAKVHKVTNPYQGKLFNVFLETVTLPNGKIKDREVVRHPGAAAMVPLLEDGKILLVKQYRHAVGDFLLEIPAGTLEAGEEAIVCAHRELAEETGYEAKNLDKLAEILPAPGYTDERIHIYLATGLAQSQQSLQDDEVLEVELIDFDKAIALITQGEIKDGKTIAGLLLTSMRR